MTVETLNLLYLLGALERIVTDFKTRGEHSVELGSVDPYHTLLARDAIDIYAEPDLPLPVGSVDDDIATLQALLNDPDRAAIPADLETLGNLLRIVAARLDATRG